jgi:hypothetical protein
MKYLIVLVMLVSVSSKDIRLNRLNEVFRGSVISKIDVNTYNVDGCEVVVTIDGSKLSNDSYNEIINCLGQ